MEEYKEFCDITEDIKNLRYEVFCVEQKIDQKDEWDNLDKGMFHFCLYKDGLLIAYCRCFLENSNIHIGRVVVKKEYRKQGYGRKIIAYAEQKLLDKSHTFVLGAQEQAIPFYSKLGYQICSSMFLDAGIPHYLMKKIID